MKGERDSAKDRGNRRGPSGSMLLAIVALIAAMAATGYAAGHLSGKQIKKRSEPGNRFKKNTIKDAEVNLGKLGQVPSAANAQTLQGHSPAEFLTSDIVKRFSVKLSFGQSQDLFTAGPLTFTANCVKNQTDIHGNPNRDFVDILIGTSQNGVVFEGQTSKLGDAGPGSFLNNSTPSGERVFNEAFSADTGTSYYDAEGSEAGGAIAPDGTMVSLNSDGTAGAVNESGTDCMLTGSAVVASG